MKSPFWSDETEANIQAGLTVLAFSPFKDIRQITGYRNFLLNLYFILNCIVTLQCTPVKEKITQSDFRGFFLLPCFSVAHFYIPNNALPLEVKTSFKIALKILICLLLKRSLKE